MRILAKRDSVRSYHCVRQLERIHLDMVNCEADCAGVVHDKEDFEMWVELIHQNLTFGKPHGLQILHELNHQISVSQMSGREPRVPVCARPRNLKAECSDELLVEVGTHERVLDLLWKLLHESVSAFVLGLISIVSPPVVKVGFNLSLELQSYVLLSVEPLQETEELGKLILVTIGWGQHELRHDIDEF